jgi:hypothetical protein
MAYPITDQSFMAQTVQLNAVNTTKQAIPHAWYQHLVNEQGKVQLNAVTILSEIVYWYTPVPIYDRSTKKIIGYQKKFKEDILQKSYRDLSIKFGLTKNQVKSGILFLEKEGLIERDIRNINQDSTPINNVLYINLKFDKLLEIYQVPEKSTNLRDEEIDNNCFFEEETIEELDVKKEKCEVSNVNIEKEIFEKQEVEIASDLTQNLACDTTLLNQKNISPEKNFGGRDIILEGGVSKKLHTYTCTTSKTTSSCNKSLNSDRSLTFSKEESLFLEELLAIKPHEGKPIEKSSATWWIKFFGIDKIKTALAVYWQRVNKALKCFWFEGPRDIGGTIRQALKNNTQVYQEPVKKTAMSQTANPSKAFINNTLEPAYVSKNASQIKLQAVYEPKSNSQESLKSVEQAELKTQTDLQPLQVQKEEIKVDIEAMSQSELEAMLKAEIEAIYEPRPIAPEKQEVIAQEKVEVAPQLQSTVYKPLENLLQKQLETITKSKAESVEPVEVTANSQKPLIIQPTLEKAIQDSAQIVQKPLNANAAQKAFMYFNEDEKKCLRYLLNYIPAKGEKIPETEATWWIKEFGVAKVKTAMQVYAQQVEKASKSSAVPMPESIGGYVRNALNQGLQPCREMDLRNKSFAEEFKQKMNWADLVITEKYCSAKNIGKEWFYHVNEALFKQSLQECYTNCFSDHGYARGI